MASQESIMHAMMQEEIASLKSYCKTVDQLRSMDQEACNKAWVEIEELKAQLLEHETKACESSSMADAQILELNTQLTESESMLHTAMNQVIGLEIASLKADNKFLRSAVTLQAEQLAECKKEITVKVSTMTESNGCVTHSVWLACEGKEMPWDWYQVYSDSIEGRAQYEAANLRHFLGLGDKPDILAFDTDAVISQKEEA